MYVAKITYIFVCMCVYMCLSNFMALYQTCPLVSFPDPPPPFRQFHLDRGRRKGLVTLPCRFCTEEAESPMNKRR